MEFNLEEIKELHKNRKWISWEEEGYLISCVEKLEASNKKLREAIENFIDWAKSPNGGVLNIIDIPDDIYLPLTKALEE